MQTGLRQADHLWTYIAGTAFNNVDGSSRQEQILRLHPCERLELVRDPANPHDRNAVEVRRVGGGQLGFLPRRMAAKIAPRLDQGRPHCAYAIEITAREAPRDGDDFIALVHGVRLLVVEGPPEESDLWVRRRFTSELDREGLHGSNGTTKAEVPKPPARSRRQPIAEQASLDGPILAILFVALVVLLVWLFR